MNHARRGFPAWHEGVHRDGENVSRWQDAMAPRYSGGADMESETGALVSTDDFLRDDRLRVATRWQSGRQTAYPKAPWTVDYH